MMEAVRTSETSVDNYFTRQYIPEDNSEYLCASNLFRSFSLLLIEINFALVSNYKAVLFRKVKDESPHSGFAHV
jgi:hypothetical protein